MKFKLFLFLLIIVSFSNCKNSDDHHSPSVSVNDFVWKGMNIWYYWQKDVPDLADNRFNNDVAYNQFLNQKSTPDLFKSLLFHYGTIDRFSWIVNDYDALNNNFAGIRVSFGMDYSLVYNNQNSGDIFGFVQYVTPNSPAENAGMKRGFLFNRINGTQLNEQNYNQLLNQNVATFGMAQLENGQITSLDQEIQIYKTEVSENPIHLAKIIELNSKKVGYLVYNNFRANYNHELNQVIGDFVQNGATELIVDLRYNGGGSVQTSAYFGSMIAGQHTGQPFTNLTFNEKASNNNVTYKFENTGKSYNDDLTVSGEFTLNHMNLSRIFILTSKGSASASEMLISCLKPYMQVTTIGTQTYGKTVGSITLYDSPSSYYTSKNNINTKHKWAMQPIVFEYQNSLNESSPTHGISPDYEINELNYLENILPLGNINEPLLSKALELIGDYTPITQPFNFFQLNSFKNSTQVKPFGSELYLDSGFELNP